MIPIYCAPLQTLVISGIPEPPVIAIARRFEGARTTVRNVDTNLIDVRESATIEDKIKKMLNQYVRKIKKGIALVDNSLKLE